MSSVTSNCTKPGHVGDISKKEAEVGILPSHGISLDVLGDTQTGRPPIIQHLSAPTYQSPLRHHRRQPSQHREVKTTLDARSEYTNNEDDGKAEHRINQYIIKDEIGRGSFGAVHLAVDQYGKEYAVKEFSKSRLRKRAQSNILRRPHAARRPGHLAAGLGFNSPLHQRSASDIHNGEEQGNPLYLIKEEIAIMKKLDHPNLVSLIEVLDDPEEDSLYMVLEMCKKGVVMKVGLGEQADPYATESCRCWFRDLILGIEYLHAQGVVHRDIKPDNLLLTEDDVLKIVDFGVSEMFEKQSEMMTAKSAGSPAFLPPELCITKHGDISGKAADIWSMGVSLYCLRFGRIPFERSGVLELYEAIKNDAVNVEPETDPQFCDLIRRLLDKDPKTRIKMAELREHPWVTKNGTDPLLSAEENTADLVEPPSEIEVNHAITGKMRNLLTMMKAVKKFKKLIEDHKRPTGLSDALGRGVRALQSSSLLGVDGPTEPTLSKSKGTDLDERPAVEVVLAAEGVHHNVAAPGADSQLENRLDSSTAVVGDEKRGSDKENEQRLTPTRLSSDEVPELQRTDSGEKGHAHDPLDEEPLFLGIGAGSHGSLEPPLDNIVAESPTAADFSIYNTAYEEEVNRIRAAKGEKAIVYLTRRVDGKREYKVDENMIDVPSVPAVAGEPHEAFEGLVNNGGGKVNAVHAEREPPPNNYIFSDIAARAIENSKSIGRDLSDKGGLALGTILQKASEEKGELYHEKGA
ncbi:BcCMK3, calcium/calmodulin-dependent protein kinase [Tricladium varicosporioides]|nr:BcCMK3, calcium/calmodulin-dependent protein kinase [Hymenoscyphus varicosporioides]